MGVKFVFESFDLEKDRVVFRPLVKDNQYRFRTGMTLQSPQLEEVAVKSTGGEIDMRRVQCDRGRYFTIKPAERAAPAAAAVREVSQHSQEDGVELEVDGDMEADVDLGADGVETPETAAVATETEATSTTLTANTVTTPAITTTPAPSQVIQTTSTTRKRTADEKSYQGTKNFLDRSCPVPVRKTGIRKMDGTRYSFLQTYPWTLEYQVESEIMGSLVALEGERRSGSDSTSRSSNGKGKTVDYESKSHIGNTRSSSSPAEGKDQLTTDNQHHHQLHRRPQDEIVYAPLSYERVDSNDSNSSSGSGSDSGNISSRDNTHSSATTTTTSRRRANSPVMADKIADKSAHGVSARTTHHQGSAGNNSNSNSGNGPRFLRTLRFECSMNFLDPKRATRSVLGRWLEGKVYQWSKVLGGKKVLSNGQSHAIQWQPTLKQQSQSQPHLRQQQKRQEKQQERQKGKQKDSKQKQPLSASALYRRLQNQDQLIRRSDTTTETGGPDTTTPPHAPAAPTAAAPPRRRGRVIRAIDILLGPTDNDGSSINHERVRQHSMNSPFHAQSSSQSGSSASLSLSPPHQGDASIAGGRCMIPAIDLNKMGSSSTSATF